VDGNDGLGTFDLSHFYAYNYYNVLSLNVQGVCSPPASIMCCHESLLA
jgi:hypothetical protein